jgi:hypothetical protein
MIVKDSFGMGLEFRVGVGMGVDMFDCEVLP